MLLEMLLGGGDELDGGELEATGLEASDDGADETALEGLLVFVFIVLTLPRVAITNEVGAKMEVEGGHEEQLTYLNAIRLDSNEAIQTPLLAKNVHCVHRHDDALPLMKCQRTFAR